MSGLRFWLAPWSLAAVVGCGGAPTAPVVVSVPRTTVKPLDVEPPAQIRVVESPFELTMSYGPCATIGGKLYCPDQLSPTRSFASSIPTPNLDGVASAAFGRDFWCAALRDGHVKCGGGNRFGQLGAGLADEAHEAVLLPTLEGAKRVVSGPFTSCAILAKGSVACWGKNQFGESGSSTTYLAAARELVEPEVVPGLTDVEEVAIGWDSACATTTKGDVHCWGRAKLDEHEKLRGPQHESPATIKSLRGATSLTANESSFCAIRGEKVVCWGDLMMLGDHDGPRRSLRVFEMPSARRVSLGANHGCAVTAAGEVYCFGSNYGGALGTKAGPEDYMPHAPEKVPGIPPALDVKCGSGISCAVTAGHEVHCWGRIGQAPPSPPTRMRITE